MTPFPDGGSGGSGGVAQMWFAVPDCFGYASCQQNCPPAPAIEDGSSVCPCACAQNYPMSEPAFEAMTACLQMSCAGVCPY